MFSSSFFILIKLVTEILSLSKWGVGLVVLVDRSSRPDMFCKKVLLEFSQNSQENTCTESLF